MWVEQMHGLWCSRWNGDVLSCSYCTFSGGSSLCASQAPGLIQASSMAVSHQALTVGSRLLCPAVLCSPEEYRERMAAEIGFAIGAQASMPALQARNRNCWLLLHGAWLGPFSVGGQQGRGHEARASRAHGRVSLGCRCPAHICDKASSLPDAVRF